ncbi:hypothetical protein [Cereibacter johrii]|uniref:hypothetical protein n=1 Tax=Cereibacter johrii TaxID=445629 RepID=UPI003CFA0623
MRLAPLLLGIFAASQADAGPDATANRFINDTPSMMDWGTYRLELRLAAAPELGSPSVYYDWDRNRIIIYKGMIINRESTVKEEDDCRDWVTAIRRAAIVDPETGKLALDGVKSSIFSSFFSHSGFSRSVLGITEEEALRELDKMFTMEAAYYRTEEGRLDPSLTTCRAELLDNKIAIEK